jgi:ubiquinone/menaquinone biosynthesis C-methylase UbiE
VPAVAQAAASRPDLRLLDCGCGTGHNLQFLGLHGKAFGFDLMPASLALASRAGRPLARADVTRIPFQDTSFDVVTTFDVLQAVADDQGALREVARVLKPGGALIATAAAMAVLRGGHAALWPEFRRYTRGSMTHLVEGAGLRVERVSYLFGALYPLLLPVRVMQRVRKEASEEDWEMNVPPAPVNVALSWMLRAEAAITRRVPLAPAGSSVMVVARKPR